MIAVDEDTIDQINRIFHLSGIVNLQFHHELIHQIELIPNVKWIEYNLIANERFMDFTKFNIYFKKKS